MIKKAGQVLFIYWDRPLLLGVVISKDVVPIQPQSQNLLL